MTAATEKFGSIGGFESLLDDSYVFKNLTKKDYPQFVTKTIRLLANNSGLNIRFAKKAEESCFNPENKTVYIPAPPAFQSEGKKRKEFEKSLARWRGVLNHEVGHAQFTLWRADRESKTISKEEKTYPLRHHMFNDLFENGRMERVACQNYPGMIRDLQKLEDFLKEVITNLYNKDKKNFNYIYYALRMVVNGYEPVIPIPEEMKKDWEVVKEIAEEAWGTDDEEETYKIARKAEEYLKERYEEEMENLKSSQSEEEKLEKELEALERLQEKLKSGDISESKGEGSADDEGGEGEEGGEGGIGEGDIDLKPSAGKKAKEEEKEKSARVKELEEKIAEKKKEINEEIKKQKDIKVYVDHIDVDNAQKVDPVEEFETHYTEDLTFSSHDSDVIPLPLNDYVKNVEVKTTSHSTHTKEILAECMGPIAGMAQRFIQKVRSRMHVGVRTYKGRVNRRKLHRYKFDKNIFKTQNLRKKKDACVMIIVDCSGSMNGAKIDTARKSALVIGEMMYRAGVEFEIKGFTIPFDEEYNFPCFTRQADLIHYRFGGSKDWDHTKHNVVEGSCPYGLKDNDDGESLRHFAEEISHSKKDTKMMIVISDGAPCVQAQRGNAVQDLKNVVKDIRESGIDMYAIGLDTDAEQFYGKEKSVRLSSMASITELVEAISTFVNLITVNG